MNHEIDFMKQLFMTNFEIGFYKNYKTRFQSRTRFQSTPRNRFRSGPKMTPPDRDPEQPTNTPPL